MNVPDARLPRDERSEPSAAPQLAWDAWVRMGGAPIDKRSLSRSTSLTHSTSLATITSLTGSRPSQDNVPHRTTSLVGSLPSLDHVPHWFHVPHQDHVPLTSLTRITFLTRITSLIRPHVLYRITSLT